MRDAFASEVKLLAENNKNVVLLSGDIGNRMFDGLKKIRPNQFINCGIAESNMMSMASGMALAGMRPIVYTITPFTTLRCLEQIKIGVAYHQAPVVIVGTGSGLSYSELGPTHHSLEDMAIIRSIPNINVLAPVDSIELIAQLREAINLSMPTYIRIGKKGEPDLTNNCLKKGIGVANLLREGSKYLLLGVGPIISEALDAANILQRRGIELCIANMSGIRPLDEKFLLQMIDKNFSYWITLEEHSIIGGLGSTILEWLSDTNNLNNIKLKRIGAPCDFIHKLGNQKYTRKQLKLDSQGIAEQIIAL